MQTMKCEKIQSLLARYLRDELSGGHRSLVVNHLNECVDCRQALAFHHDLDSQMNSEMEVPAELRGRLEQRLRSQDGRLHLLARFFGDPTMKRILISSTAITAVIAAGLILVPGSAHASSPLGTFNQMRSALAAAIRTGEMSFTASVSDKGAVKVTGLLDGQPLPPDLPLNVSVTRTPNTYDIKVTADLSPANYSSIAYGRDHLTLELMPKKENNHRFEIALDPKSMKPVSWTTYTKTNGLAKVAVERYHYSPKPSALPAIVPDNVVAHMTIKVKGAHSGTISIIPDK